MRADPADEVTPREQELKLGFRRDELPLLEARALVFPSSRAGRAGAEVRHLEAVYFDTPDLDLAAGGIELRVRREVGGGWVQTVKQRAAGAPTGLFNRLESEMPLDGPSPDLSALSRRPGLALLGRKRIRGRLRPVFATRVERRVYHLAGEQGGEIELSIDVGRLSAGRRTAPLCEVELEARGESPENLFRLAETLSESVDLRPEIRGKADLGYALLQGKALLPEKACPRTVRWSRPAEEVFAGILENALRQMRANERVILLTGDPEAVHQMRVALRRLRACLSAFRPRLPDGEVEPVRAWLRGMLAVLGPARDWDVLVTDRLAAVETGSAGEPLFAEVLTLAGKARAKAAARLRKFLLSREYGLMVLRLTGWISCRRWRRRMSRGELRQFRGSVGKMARNALETGHHRLERAGADLSSGEDAAWHALRIAIKRQRYLLDSFEDCFAGKVTSRYAGALQNLQEALGELQDLVTARDLLGGLGRGRTGEVRAFLGGMVAGQTGERACLRERVLQGWSEFSEMKRPWHERR
ncbi:MAG: CYTH and CHAD domain-containing protein [Verrucomicrobia bacterium]|nr:CYTH and CHAD domain-containing protein [Verrucomicrobiota bacterium]